MGHLVSDTGQRQPSSAAQRAECHGRLLTAGESTADSWRSYAGHEVSLVI